MKKVNFALLFLLSINLANAQYTIIPDPNFEQALIAYGYDDVIDGEVFTDSINTLTELTVFGWSITDLSGIEDFISLEDLDCSANFITDLDLNQNTNLINLNTSYNQLSELDVSSLVNLVELSCADNLLSTVDVTQNQLLTRLICSNNNISDIDLSQNQILSLVILQENQLTSIDLSQNDSLSFLAIPFNELSAIDVSQNSNLTIFSCGDNQITSLDLSNNLQLEDLHCSSNEITELDLTQNQSLSLLSCSDNLLTSLDLSQNSTLTQFFCSSNQLSCLNMKNGNNTDIESFYFVTSDNPNLSCIEVDNEVWSMDNWFAIDAASSFSENCSNDCSTGLDDVETSMASLNLFPNPTSGRFTIELGESKTSFRTTLTNNIGEVIFEQEFEPSNRFEFEIDAPAGIYILKIENNVGTKRNFKIVKL